MDLVGWLYALVALILFGLYMVPRKLSGLRDFGFVLSMCLGAVVTTQAAQFLVHGGRLLPMPAHAAWLAFSCGLIWSLGMLSYTLSVSQMGLSLSTPIKNTTAVLGTIFGLAIFQEWHHTNPWLAILGSLFVVACAIVLGLCGEKTENPSHVTPLGVFWALSAALWFAAYTIPLKYAQMAKGDSYQINALMGLGTLCGGIVLFLAFSKGRRGWLKAPLKDHLFAALAGATWALALMAMTQAIPRIGLAVTWPVTNLNTIVTVAAGIFVFHEISFRKYRGLIVLSLLFAIIGSGLLGLAKA